MDGPSDKPLTAHSLAEAYLYLMATACSGCGKGPLEGSDARRIAPTPAAGPERSDAARVERPSDPTRDQPDEPDRPSDAPDSSGPSKANDAITVVIDVSCGACAWRGAFRFFLENGTCVDGATALPCVNPKAVSSHIIDVAQWITLFRVIAERAGREPDKREARRLGLEAAQCLEEALKFYEDGNDVPPASAFFHERSRRSFQDHPEAFSRRRLLHLRSKLPALSIMRDQASGRGPRKKPRRWWRR